MEKKNSSTGKRRQIIILQVNRNSEGTIKELYRLKNHFRKNEKESYTYLNSFYGSPPKVLKRTVEWYLDSNELANPVKTLYEINKSFIDKRLVKSEDVANMGLYSEFEHVVDGLKKMFGLKRKEKK